MAGRPRNPSATNAILAAAIGILKERGYAKLTFEEVARVTGVGKSTLYSRFESRSALAGAAVASLQRELPAPAGELRADLISLLRAAERNLTQLGVGVFSSLISEASAEDPLWLEGLFDPFSRRIRRLLELGRGGGTISPRADMEAGHELLVGVLITRVLLGERLGEPWPARAVDAVLASLAPSGSQGSGNGWSGIG